MEYIVHCVCNVTVMDLCASLLMGGCMSACVCVCVCVCLFRIYLKIVLGSVNVSLLSKHDKCICFYYYY